MYEKLKNQTYLSNLTNFFTGAYSQKKIYQGKFLTDQEKNYKHSDPLIISIDNITKFKA